MKTIKIIAGLALALTCFSCQNNDDLPIDLEKARVSLTLTDGSLVSSADYDDYNPVLVLGDDGHLYLIFASNRPCAAGCSNYNIFICKSQQMYFEDAFELPVFEGPLPLTQNSSPFNFATRPNFTAKAFSGMLVIYAVEGGVIRYGNALDFVSTSYNVGAGLNNITNTGQQNAGILGIGHDGTLFSQSTGDEIFNFNAEGAGSYQLENFDLVDAYSVAHLPFGVSFVGLPLIAVLADGDIVAADDFEILGSFDNFTGPLEASGLSASALNIYHGLFPGNDFITFSAGPTADADNDLYVVTNQSASQLWLTSFE